MELGASSFLVIFLDGAQRSVSWFPGKGFRAVLVSNSWSYSFMGAVRSGFFNFIGIVGRLMRGLELRRV